MPLHSSWLGVLAFLLLVFAPGAWVTFGLRLFQVPFWARLFTGAMLSPVIVAVQFFCLRSAGLRFETTIFGLVLVNAPALWLIRKNAGKLPERGAWILAAAALAVPVICLGEFLLYPAARIFSSHAWVYADPV